MIIDPFGKIKICCNQADVPLGIYPEQSLKEIWFGETRRKIISELSQGHTPGICSACLGKAAFNTSPSSKITTSRTYGYSRFEEYPKYLELSLSNHCNLKCAMCSWDSSNQFVETDAQRALFFNFGDEFLEEIRPFITAAAHIGFSGGEPFLIPLYFQLWEMIGRINPEATVYIQTNGTQYNERIEEVLKRPGVSVGISVDAIEKDTFQRIRVGADHARVIQNIEHFRELCRQQGAPLSFTITPMTLNVHELTGLFSYCYDRHIRINISLLDHPAPFALWTLPSSEIAVAVRGISELPFVHEKQTDVTDLWNHGVVSSFRELLIGYQGQKALNESNRANWIARFNKLSAGAELKLIQEIRSISDAVSGDVVSMAVSSLLHQVAAAYPLEEMKDTSGFLATQFQASEVVLWHQRFGTELFMINGRKKLQELIHIFRSNSFDRLVAQD